jgi:hypothetical protein
VIAAWPSLALISAYELLMRQVRRGAVSSGDRGTLSRPSSSDSQATGRWRRLTPVGSVERSTAKLA